MEFLQRALGTLEEALVSIPMLSAKHGWDPGPLVSLQRICWLSQLMPVFVVFSLILQFHPQNYISSFTTYLLGEEAHPGAEEPCSAREMEQHSSCHDHKAEIPLYG